MRCARPHQRREPQDRAVRAHHRCRSLTRKTPSVGRAPTPEYPPPGRAFLSGLAGDLPREGMPRRSSGIAWPSLWRGWRHPTAVGIDDQTGQQTRRLRADRQGALAPIGGELVLHDLPKLRINDRLVLVGVGFALVNDLAPIEPVLQHQVEGAAEKCWPPASCPPAPSRRLLTIPSRSSSALSKETEPSS